jgi:hypothetical protein
VCHLIHGLEDSKETNCVENKSTNIRSIKPHVVLQVTTIGTSKKLLPIAWAGEGQEKVQRDLDQERKQKATSSTTTE